MSSINSIVFDLDGVLIVGSNQGYLDCHHHALETVGIKLSRQEEKEKLLQFWSYPHEFQLRLFIGADEERLTLACQAYEDFLFSERFFGNVEVVPGAKETVENLGMQGYELAVATGMHNRQIDIVFQKLDIDKKLFKFVISGYEIESDELQKPHPYMLIEIMRRLQTTNTGTVYIGDSKDDIIMAKRASVHSVAVLTGNLTRQQAEQELADFIIDTVKDLPSVLEILSR